MGIKGVGVSTHPYFNFIFYYECLGYEVTGLKGGTCWESGSKWGGVIAKAMAGVGCNRNSNNATERGRRTGSKDEEES